MDQPEQGHQPPPPPQQPGTPPGAGQGFGPPPPPYAPPPTPPGPPYAPPPQPYAQPPQPYGHGPQPYGQAPQPYAQAPQGQPPQPYGQAPQPYAPSAQGPEFLAVDRHNSVVVDVNGVAFEDHGVSVDFSWSEIRSVHYKASGNGKALMVAVIHLDGGFFECSVEAKPRERLHQWFPHLAQVLGHYRPMG